MPASDFLKLVPLKTAEPNLTWEQFCQNPYLLLVAFAENFVVEGKFLEELPAIIYSEDAPDAGDRNKIWIKTSNPYGIALFIAGQYQIIYVGYQPNVPFLADPNKVDMTVQGLTQISDEDILAWGIPQTTVGAANRYRWYIFQPGDIEV